VLRQKYFFLNSFEKVSEKKIKIAVSDLILCRYKQYLSMADWGKK